jgi:hypothetical protein
MVGTDDISAMHKSFATSLRTENTTRAQQQIIRLPATQNGAERVPFFVSGFDNLKSAVKSIE